MAERKFTESRLEEPTTQSSVQARQEDLGVVEQPVDNVVEQTITQVTDAEVERATDSLESGVDRLIEQQEVKAPEIKQVQAPTEDVQVEQLKQEEPKIEPIEPVEAPEIEPVQDVQVVESNKLTNESNREKLELQKEQKATTQFSEMLRSGATNEELADFVNSNSQFKKSFNSIARDTFKTRANSQFFSQYNGMSNEAMDAAVKEGKLVPGSNQYNLLSEQQRARYEAYAKREEAITLPQKTDFTASEKVQNTFSLEEQVNKLFDFNLREESRKLFTSDAIVDTTNQLAEKKTEIDKLDIKLEDIEDEMRKKLGDDGFSPAYINSAIRDEKNSLIKEKRLLLAEHNALLGQYQNLKSDAERELEFLVYEDTQDKAIYQMKLEAYQSAGEMTEIEKLQFEEESKIRAEDRKLQNDLILTKFKSDLEEEGVKGSWKTLEDGEYFLRDDGSFQKVIDGKLLGRTAKRNITSSTFQNDDGSTTTVFRDNDNQNINQVVTDAAGNIVYPGGTTSKGTDLRFLQGQYPGQAWAKNNNSAGITWHAASAGLKSEWADAGIRFSEGTARPANEGGNYVDFPTIQDGLAAHAITLGRKRSSILNGLSQWVGTPNPDTNRQYALDLYNASGIEKPIDTPLNQLNDQELYSLMKVQIKRESPGLYGELASNGWLGDTGFKIPVKDDTGAEKETRRKLTEDEWKIYQDIKADFEEEQVVKDFENSLVSTKNLITSLSKNDGAGDVGAIFQFMKSLDPQSVVRESEFQLAADTAGVDEKLMTKFLKLKSGDRLPLETRKKFTQLALEYLKNRGDSYNRKYEEAQADYSTQIEGQDFPMRNAVQEIDEIIRKQYGKSNIDDFLESKGFGKNTSQDVSGVISNIFNSIN